MDEKQFKEIIKFAIDKEIKSYTFYTSASKVARYSGAKELLTDLAKEEEGHRKLLEKLDVEKVAQVRIQPVPNLKISDYMVDGEFKRDVSFSDIIRGAM